MALVFAFLAQLILAGPASVSDPPPAAPAAKSCVTVKAEARYRPYGYDHLVHLTNGCRRTARCLVSTDVNPKEISVAVPAGRTRTVRTFVASPARVFTPRVVCRFR